MQISYCSFSVILSAQFANVFLMVGLAKSMGIFMEAFKRYFDVPTALASMVMAAAAVVYAFVGECPFALVGIGQYYYDTRSWLLLPLSMHL